jgi:uncharacterized circularly permuted ATP-grasp superfamily protein
MSDLGMIGNRDSVSAADLEPLLAGYRPLSGIFDEMMDRRGRVRAHWQPLLAMLARLGPQELSRRFAAADRHLHESGVFYRVYEDASGAERPWPLSHVPLLINGSEWQTLKAGLIQRAELHEAVLADAYGPANLVRERRLPAAVIAGNPEFLPTRKLRRCASATTAAISSFASICDSPERLSAILMKLTPCLLCRLTSVTISSAVLQSLPTE